MYNIYITKSKNKNKKFTAFIYDIKGRRIKKVNFGARGMSDYTIHKNPKRKSLYLQRHKKNENWNNILTPGFYSRFILWNKPSISKSLEFLNKKYKNKNIKFIFMN